MLGFVAGVLAGIGIFIGGWAFLAKSRLTGAIEVVVAVAAFALSLMKPGALPWYLIVLYVAIVILTVINLWKIRAASKVGKSKRRR